MPTYCKATRDIVAADMAKMPGTVDHAHMEHAMLCGHPLLSILDACMVMALRSRKEFGQDIAGDYYAQPAIVAILKNARHLMSWDAGKASTGTLESLFWAVVETAGLAEGDVQ